MSWKRLVECLEGLEQFGIEPGLDRMRAGLKATGHPQDGYRVVNVAGTNGKGTVASLIAAVLQHHGLRVGLYTSPHLLDIRERFRVDGRPLSVDRLDPVAGRILQKFDFDDTGGRPPLTFFECTTLVAATAFEACDVDIGVFEVGLGGRLDAVNAIEPDLGVVTAIGRDHTDILGTTIEEIAREKAGIFRAGIPAVVGPQRYEAARRVLVEEANRRKTPVECVGQQDLDSGSDRIASGHQAVARRAARRMLADDFTDEEFRRGISRWRWPGRFEDIELDDGQRLFVDTAHNAEAIDVLRDVLGQQGDRFGAVVWGAMADKDVGEIRRLFADVDSPVWGAELEGERARSGRQLAGEVPDRLWRGAGPTRSVFEEAVEATNGDVLVFGSVYLVGELYRVLDRSPESLRTWR